MHERKKTFYAYDFLYSFQIIFLFRFTTPLRKREKFLISTFPSIKWNFSFFIITRRHHQMHFKIHQLEKKKRISVVKKENNNLKNKRELFSAMWKIGTNAFIERKFGIKQQLYDVILYVNIKKFWNFLEASMSPPSMSNGSTKKGQTSKNGAMRYVYLCFFLSPSTALHKKESLLKFKDFRHSLSNDILFDMWKDSSFTWERM